MQLATKIRLNREITAPQVRLIGLDGQQVGVVSLAEALEQASEAGYDLAEIAPQANPPVVKILDWGKYRYEQTKQQQKSRKHQKSVEVKEVRLGLKIGDHDLNVKLVRAQKFLAEGNKVKISARFRGREITHPELGQALLKRAVDQLAEQGVVESEPSLSGREMSLVVGPRKEVASKPEAKQDAETENP